MSRKEEWSVGVEEEEVWGCGSVGGSEGRRGRSVGVEEEEEGVWEWQKCRGLGGRGNEYLLSLFQFQK